MKNELALLSLVNSKGEEQIPKSMSIKKGEWYHTTSGGQVKIVSIRTSGENVMIYFKGDRNDGIMNVSLEEFKSRLIELGSVDEIFINAVK